MKKSIRKSLGVSVLALSLVAAIPMVSYAGWQSNKQGYWYENGNGQYFTNSWQQIDGKWYHFDAAGYMQTGWYLENNNWYYLGLDGARTYGWQYVNGLWYYLDPSTGAMRTGWQELGDKAKDWYYLNADGSMRTGWFYDSGFWYLLDSDGKMLKGWQKVGNDWYFLNESGQMLTGQQEINGGYYLLGADGRWIESTDNRSLLGPTSAVEATTTLEANMSTAKILGLANYYYDIYYNDINSAFAYLNDLRDNGHKLNYSESLCKAATAHAIDMISYNYFGHDNSNSKDVVEWQYWPRLNNANIDGESIVFDNSIHNCFESLKASKDDLENLQNTGYTTAGVGIAKRADGMIYMTIMLQK